MGTITEGLPKPFVDASPDSNTDHERDNNRLVSTLQSPPQLPSWGEDRHLLPPILRPRPPQPCHPPSITAETKEQTGTARRSNVLASARHALVVGWSSMGLGHTARAFSPILLAAQEGTLAAGDVVIVHVPLPWGNEHKQFSANKTLNDFRLALQNKDIKVAFIRTDKTVRADYIGPDSYLGKEGHSNNVAAAFSFASQPYRPEPPASTIEWDELFAHTANIGARLDQAALEDLPIVTASHLLSQLKASATLSATGGSDSGHKPQAEPEHATDSCSTKTPPRIAVLTDMAPDLAKAAVATGIWSVSQANHGNLLTLPSAHSISARQTAAEANRTLCMWSRGMEFGAEGDHIHAHAQISVERNTLSGFKSTARQMRESFKIDETTSKADARKIIAEAFLAQGKRINKSPSQYNGEPGIFASDDQPQNIVLLYLQGMTKEYGQRILSKLEERDPHYTKTMFVVCSAGTFTEGVNALQVGMFAHAGIVMAGGFGTTSEAWRALEHGDYQGIVNVRPVPFQREQETNATRMREHFSAGGSVVKRVVVSSDDDWADQLDDMVKEGIASPPTGDMSRLFAIVDAAGSNAEHTKKLLFNEEEPTPTERRINLALADARRDNVTKATFRLLTKVLIPTLGTIANNQGNLDQPFEFKISRKSGVTKFSGVDDLISALGDKDRLSGLLGVQVHDADFGIYKTDIVEALQIMKTQSPHVRVMHAQVMLRLVNEGLSAGS